MAVTAQMGGHLATPIRALRGADRSPQRIDQTRVTVGARAGRVSSEAAAEIRALKRRNAELEQTIEILKAATSFFVRESDPRSRR